MMTSFPALRTAFLAATVLVLAPAHLASAGLQTYIALGDSIAFGETDFTQDPSYGDRGYVAPFANHLATLEGGIRPNVINLAVNGESSTSFFQGGQPGVTSPLLNLNYTTPIETQNAMFLQRVATEQAAGRTVSTVSLSLGNNDLSALANTPGFLNLPFSQQFALFQQTLGTLQANYATLLTEVRTLLPNATLIVLGMYDSEVEIPGSPFAPLAPLAFAALNSLIAQEAAAFGGTYVDVLTPFTGHIADYTYALNPPADSNIHPNALGYSVIAAQMDAALVPEPSSLVLVASGAACLLLFARKRP